MYIVFTQTLDYIFQWTFNSVWYMVTKLNKPGSVCTQRPTPQLPVHAANLIFNLV